MKRLPPGISLIVIILTLSIIYWLGVPQVPFHPDESTQIFTSQDVDGFFSHPADLFWNPQAADNLLQYYRLVDAPITRSLIGLARLINGQPILPVDWNWSLSYEENAMAGSLPDKELLILSRLAVACLFPLGLWLIFEIGKAFQGTLMGWISLILLATNSLVLLHTRRAMAEGPLLVTVLISLYSLVKWKKHPWLAAIPIALAFAAKQSAAPLILAGLFAVLTPDEFSANLKSRIKRAVYFVALFTAISLILHPFLWNNPINAAQAAWNARQDLVSNQVTMFQEVAPDQVLDTLPKRILACLGNLFLTPPAIEDVGNYTAELEQSANAYLANPLHSLLRDTTGAGLFFAFSLMGFIVANRDALRSTTDHRRDLSLLLIAAILQFTAQILFIPLPFQRYTIPLVPYACLLSAYCLSRLIDKYIRARKANMI